MGADFARLHHCCLASRRWCSVATETLINRELDDDAVAATIIDEGDKGGPGDDLETDDQGRLYVTDGEHNAIHRRHPDGHLYVTANQLHRQGKYRGGKDERQYPYVLSRTRIDAGPVNLR
ncbi:hypothetical protein [Amycolatopsis vancoresmycina]|uniref:SMP-30/Gluconolactonase/LRE-like region domain-containing protein n=1 Tax=Amycolatopsis vancoresmycina DSM 44592 TaxID=1292037 RepID=R1IJG7_9PSEU|nr:hypothetical protein [Amycolatopsis vancoresmycina]EOD70499.1 hypothetical protein H480_00780 [Amycolatopsis vancoresmycina DSM 44592]